jgi:hypothetical protein
MIVVLVVVGMLVSMGDPIVGVSVRVLGHKYLLRCLRMFRSDIAHSLRSVGAGFGEFPGWLKPALKEPWIKASLALPQVRLRK